MHKLTFLIVAAVVLQSCAVVRPPHQRPHHAPCPHRHTHHRFAANVATDSKLTSTDLQLAALDSQFVTLTPSDDCD